MTNWSAMGEDDFLSEIGKSHGESFAEAYTKQRRLFIGLASFSAACVLLSACFFFYNVYEGEAWGAVIQFILSVVHISLFISNFRRYNELRERWHILVACRLTGDFKPFMESFR